MNFRITADAIGQAWFYALLVVGIVGIFWKPAWVAFFGLGTVALAYAGNWLMFPYAILFAVECIERWSGEPVIVTVCEALRR